MNTIRYANLNDILGINKLLGQVLGVHNAGRPDIFKPVGQKYLDKELEEVILNRDNPVWVCVDDNETVLGHCFCQVTDKKESGSCYAYKTIYIDDLCVDEDCRGQKIGTALYNHVLAYAKENGFYNVTLHAWECNPAAVGFYKSLGMQIQQYTMEEIVGDDPSTKQNEFML